MTSVRVRVWLGGEGPSEIGDRDLVGGERVGALEALLRKVEPSGWGLEGATRWSRIRKFKVSEAIGRDNHGDIHSIAGLVLEAFEAGCEVVAFSRDVDADERREDAIAEGILLAKAKVPMVAIIGGAAIPALEGWILALLGVRDTEDKSRRKCDELLAERDLDGKHAEDYVAVIEAADLSKIPPGSDALVAWLALARQVLGTAIRGA